MTISAFDLVEQAECLPAHCALTERLPLLLYGVNSSFF
jgi:hypothetical protein